MPKHLIWIQHLESYVHSSCSPEQKTISLDAVAFLVQSDVFTVEAMVREMEMYLTTTDDTIRAKGILFLAEVLARLEFKPLASSTLHSLIEFFTERLGDWKAFHGALVGCLALMRRNTNAGMILSSDAKMAAQRFFQNQQVQVLGQHERKLCFELLECLLNRYSDALVVLGDALGCGICEAIDGETDPQCLVHTFHIVELLGRLSPTLSAGFEEEICGILGSYFPIHFTHSVDGVDIDIQRDVISKALMAAFVSTPLFEPFVIPFLLEKLSSSLPVAKVDSLKYLSCCTLKYGQDRMEKHADAIWSSIKEAINTSMQGLDLSNKLMSDVDMSIEDSKIVTEALELLQTNITQNPSLFLNLIIRDEEFIMFIDSMASFKFFSDFSFQSKQKLYALGRILSYSAKASIFACSDLLSHFFPRSMDILGYSVKSTTKDNSILSERFSFGVLYICLEILSACRDLLLDSEHLTSESDPDGKALQFVLHSYSNMLFEAFSSTLIIITENDDVVCITEFYVAVRGLQTLATFPGDFSQLSKVTFESILQKLVSIVTTKWKKMFPRKLALEALVRIGSSVECCNDLERPRSYMSIVVEKLVLLVTLDDFSHNFLSKCEALYDVGTSGLRFMLRVAQGLEETIVTVFSEIYIFGNSTKAPIAIQLLECYSSKVLPWLYKMGNSEEISLRFASNIWNQIEHIKFFGASSPHEKGLLDATMTAMKLSVGSCSEEAQCSIVEKAHSVLLLRSSWFKESLTVPSATFCLGILQSPQCLEGFSFTDEWLISMFVSVIIALRPETDIKNLWGILNLLSSAFLMGQISAAQALASVLNKLPSKINGAKKSSGLFLEDALDIIFDRRLWNFNHGIENTPLCSSTVNSELIQIHAIVGLGWMGKGLLMRGHESVKDITMILLRCLLSNGDGSDLPLILQNSNIEQDLISSVRKSAADAFHIFMRDTDTCLIKNFHAIIRPLYKQRFFSSMMPLLLSAMVKYDSADTRLALYRVSGYIISESPLTAILGEANKIVPVLVHGLLILCEDIRDKDLLYNLLLVLAGLLTDKNGEEVITENAHLIINCLTRLVSYPHMMLVREIAIQCLTAVSALPYSRIYAMRAQVLKSVNKAFDDPKRAVRKVAVKCRRIWSSIGS